VGIKAHSECRRQRVLSRTKAHLDVCADKRRYNKNWCTSALLVLNIEVGFSRTNVDSLCGIGRSTKKGSIGIKATLEKKEGSSKKNSKHHGLAKSTVTEAGQFMLNGYWASWVKQVTPASFHEWITF
jgi:hypothetical protein